MAIRIDIFYATHDSDSPVHIELDPILYFDPLEPGETFAVDGVPRFNFTSEFLSVPRSRLIWSIERRYGTDDDTTISTQYFDGGKSRVIHRSDPDGYEELIHAFDLGHRGYLTLRSLKKLNGRWVATMAAMYNTNDDELYSLPDGAFDLAQELSVLLAQFADK